MLTMNSLPSGASTVQAFATTFPDFCTASDSAFVSVGCKRERAIQRIYILGYSRKKHGLRRSNVKLHILHDEGRPDRTRLLLDCSGIIANCL